MRIKNGFVLKNVAGSNVVVNVCGNADFNAMISLNETAVLLWEKLENGADSEQLCETLLSEYKTDHNTAEKDIKLFIKKLEDADILE